MECLIVAGYDNARWAVIVNDTKLQQNSTGEFVVLNLKQSKTCVILESG